MAARSACIIALSCLCCACASYAPCPPGLLSNDVTPDHACRVDGCTLAPDFSFGACCDAHDVSYWLGGSAAERLAVDREFRSCIVDTGKPVAAWLYFLGVRVGGVAFVPTPWRWGFGWNYPRSKPPVEPPSS